MSKDFYPPIHAATEFHCPHCGVYAHQLWSHIKGTGDNYTVHYDFNDSYSHKSNLFDADPFKDIADEEYTVSYCEHCGEIAFWRDGQILYPKTNLSDDPNNDMSDEVKALYNEARAVINDSPRAAAALIRLALQVLCKELGEKGKNINDDIKSLVSKGLDSRVQKAMDALRVVGNNGAHPGEINLNENREKVIKMFDLINFIAQKMITEPKELDNFFEELPEDAKKAIEKRDQKADTSSGATKI